jgi:hypothetical protein
VRTSLRISVARLLLAGGLLPLLLAILAPLTSMAAESETPDMSSSPSDQSTYSRPAVPEDALAGPSTRVRPLAPVSPFAPVGPDFFLKDVAAPGASGNGEPSIAVNPNNTQQLVVVSFTSNWGGGTRNAVMFFSQDGGATWARDATIPPPPGIAAAFLNSCPCDQSIDYGRDGHLYGTFLLDNFASPPTINVVTGSTTDPSQAASWSWNGNPVQLTNAAHQGNADQPWLLVNRNPGIAIEDDVYVAYDDFNGSPDARVAVSRGANPVNITIDNKAGTESPLSTNPGLRLATDPRNGTVYVAYEQSSGATQPKNVTYKVNRSTDGGATWTLNGSSDGLTVDSVKSDQAPGFKFGGVNALLGGVDHAAVDPRNGDLYVVYGVDNGAGGNKLQLRRLSDNGSGGLNVGAANAVTAAAANAALPSIAIASDGTIGILYDTFDGMSAGTPSFPQFSAHLARSTNQGASFTDEILLTFLSPANNNTSDPRQRVLGDYQEMKAVGTTFFGVFSGNRAAAVSGSTTSTIDGIFFRTLTATTLTYDGATTGDFNDAVTISATLRDATTNAPISGQPIKFVLAGLETCTGITNASGKANCSITPTEAAGTYTLTAGFSSTAELQGSTTAVNFVVMKEDARLVSSTTLHVFAQGGTATLSAALIDPANSAENEGSATPIVGQSVTMTLGTGAGSQSCSGTTDAAGMASCTISPVTVALGPQPITDSFVDPTNHYQSATNTENALVFAFLAHGSFVVGNQTDSGSVTFWGSQWAKANSLSGGVAPANFKGFADDLSPTPANCRGSWTSRPGNSSTPPDAPLPSFMAVVVSSAIDRSGSTITGDIGHIIVVATDPGYAPNPGSPGTGTVVATFC